MVIDSHVHITSPGAIASLEKYRKKEPYFDLLCSSPKNRNVTADELIAEMDRTGVDRSVVFGFGFRSQDACREANDYTIEAVNRYPDRLTGFATVNPGAEGVLQELERCRAAGLSGVGEIMPTGQETDITDPSVMETLCGFCAGQRWPVLVHVNETVGHYYPGKTEDSIREAESLAAAFPDTDFIFAHLGGGLCFYEAMPELRKTLARVHYDSAAFPFLYDPRVFAGLKEMGVLPKLVYGSDYPLLNIEVYRERLKDVPFSPEERDAFFGGTMAELLDLKPGTGGGRNG